jgi:hypothetical protein
MAYYTVKELSEFYTVIDIRTERLDVRAFVNYYKKKKKVAV